MWWREKDAGHLNLVTLEVACWMGWEDDAWLYAVCDVHPLLVQLDHQDHRSVGRVDLVAAYAGHWKEEEEDVAHRVVAVVHSNEGWASCAHCLQHRVEKQRQPAKKGGVEVGAWLEMRSYDSDWAFH